jgi:hypothetical protein
MTTQAKNKHDIAIYQNGHKQGLEDCFVDVSCNVLLTRTYGPFPIRDEALRFLDNAELALRELLDFELRVRSDLNTLGIPQRNENDW